MRTSSILKLSHQPRGPGLVASSRRLSLSKSYDTPARSTNVGCYPPKSGSAIYVTVTCCTSGFHRSPTPLAYPLVAAHLQTHRKSPKGGRPRLDDLANLAGILFVLKTAIPWEYLPRELGCDSGMTCWTRLHEWMQAGIGSESTRHCSDGCASTTSSCGIELALALPACSRLRVAKILAEIQQIVASSAVNTMCSWITVGCRL